MIAYASRTGTKRNLNALQSRGWRLLLSPKGMMGPLPSGFQYALDNGAWHAHQRGISFDEDAFVGALFKFGPSADWTVLPDIVCGGRRSLELSLSWLSHVSEWTPRVLLAVQNGITAEDIRDLIGPRVGIFVGGDTDWKLATTPMWADLAHKKHAWVHVGRVNTVRRIRMCGLAGVDSFDGTSATMFAVTIPKLDHARRQRSFRLWETMA